MRGGAALVGAGLLDVGPRLQQQLHVADVLLAAARGVRPGRQVDGVLAVRVGGVARQPARQQLLDGGDLRGVRGHVQRGVVQPAPAVGVRTRVQQTAQHLRGEVSQCCSVLVGISQ